MLEDEIKGNVSTFLKSADLVYKTGDCTSAAILYFKALFAALDCIILKKEGKVPNDHEERFRVLEQKFPYLYGVLDSIFRIYRATYRTVIQKDDCEKVRKNVREIIERYKIIKDG